MPFNMFANKNIIILLIIFLRKCNEEKNNFRRQEKEENSYISWVNRKQRGNIQRRRQSVILKEDINREFYMLNFIYFINFVCFWLQISFVEEEKRNFLNWWLSKLITSIGCWMNGVYGKCMRNTCSSLFMSV